MAAENNPFFVRPPNAYEALMAGQQGYDRSHKQMAESETKAALQLAGQALQSGDPDALKRVMGLMISVGNTKGLEAIGHQVQNEAQQRYQQQSLAQTGAHQTAQLAQQGIFQNAQIANMEQQRGLQQKQFDATIEGQKVPAGFSRGPGGNLIPVQGGPADPAYLQSVNSTKGTAIPQLVEERRKAAISQGLDTKDSNVRSYILTGKMPNENQHLLTATDKKAILEADEGVDAAQAAINAMNDAKVISKKAYAGPMAGPRGYAAGLVGSEAGQSTTDLDNLLTGNALGQLKAIFSGMPTEGERKILLEVQGSVSQPDAVRQKIYDRAIEAANRRMKFNKQRAQEMRGGTFYKTDKQNLTGPGTTITGIDVQDAPTKPNIPPPPPGFELVK